MTDLNFVIRYADGLYRNDVAVAPRYEEFRDMFSSGQIKSKIWLVEELSKLTSLQLNRGVIVGSWFSTLAFLLIEKFSELKLLCLDVDKRCEIFVNSILIEAEKEKIRAIHSDMFQYKYTEDLIINTSCEHIKNIDDWVKMLPSGATVVLQSTNYLTPTDHIKPATSLEEFKSQTQHFFTDIFFSDELDLKVYKRFMIIGKIV